MDLHQIFVQNLENTLFITACAIEKNCNRPVNLKCHFFSYHAHVITALPLFCIALLHPWIKCFTMIIFAWWLQTWQEINWEEVKESIGNSLSK